MTTLSVALPPVRASAGTEFRYALGDASGVLLSEGRAAVAVLPRADRLVLVVPARCLSWHRAKLPPLPAGRVRAALDGLLEDRLLDDPASLALAIAPAREPDGAVRIAVCDKAWLAGMLQCFEQAGRPAHRVVPEVTPLAAGDTGVPMRLLAAGTPEAATLCVADQDGVLQVPLAQAPALLPAAWQDDAGVALIAEPAVAALAASVLGRPPTVRTAGESLLESSRSNWNLAQFDLSTSGRGRLLRRLVQTARAGLQAPRWRALRWGLAAALLVHVGGLQAWAWRLEHTLDARRSQVRQLLTQTFPTVRTVIDAPVQMERELALLRQASGALSPRDLESLLSTLGQALPDGLHAQGLEFSAGQLVARGVSLSPEQFRLLAGKLPGQAYAVRQDGDRVTLRATADR